MTALLLAGLAVATLADRAWQPPLRLAQLTFRSRVVVRIQSAPVPPPVTFVERKGPRCIPRGSVLGAAILAENGVDFILRGGTRVRARFAASCPALGFYSGFYLTPSADGMICADRDVVRSRAGGECEVQRFRTLVAKQGR